MKNKIKEDICRSMNKTTSHRIIIDVMIERQSNSEGKERELRVIICHHLNGLFCSVCIEHPLIFDGFFVTIFFKCKICICIIIYYRSNFSKLFSICSITAYILQLQILIFEWDSFFFFFIVLFNIFVHSHFTFIFEKFTFAPFHSSSFPL